MPEVIRENGEILFLYDATMCNPNGDPDDENRPRMDTERERNLVSDVRLKRYIRDYLQDRGHIIYVTKAEGLVIATERLKQVLGREDQPTRRDLPELLAKLIDVRLFGATMPVKGRGQERGEPINITGPVQFNWGYSLNRVQLVESNTISSQFAAEERARQGTFGKDYRLYYSLIAFHGVISARRAEVMQRLADGRSDVAATEEDLRLLDEAMLKAIPLQATRSKVGQYPRLYARFAFQDAETFMGDPRPHLKPDPDRGLRSVGEVTLEMSGMAARLARVKDRIKRVYVWQDPELRTTANGRPLAFPAWLEEVCGTEKVVHLGKG